MWRLRIALLALLTASPVVAWGGSSGGAAPSSGGEGVAALICKEAGSTVDGEVANLDFLAGFDLVSSPAGTVTVVIDPSEIAVVTSVGLSLPSWLTVANSPITSTGTLAVTATAAQTANRFLATPNGAPGAVGLRAIVAADVPTLNQATTANAGTATTLAANGANCEAGQSAAGVDAAGAAEGCAAPSVTVPGSNTFCLFNDGGALGADAGCTYTKASDSMTLLGALTVAGLSITDSGATTTLNNPDTNGIMQLGVSKNGTGYLEIYRVDNTGRYFRFSPNGANEIVSSHGFRFKTVDGNGTGDVNIWAANFISRLGVTASYAGWTTVANAVQKATGNSDASAPGWVQTGGSCVVAADQTNATTTPQTAACYNVTAGGVAIALLAGRSYAGNCELFLSDSTAVDGAVIDFDASTATATTFRAQITAFDTALNLSTQVTALATDASASTFTGNGAFEVHLFFKVNAAGTFQPRFFQAAHTAGTLTLAAGSNCRLQDVTP